MRKEIWREIHDRAQVLANAINTNDHEDLEAPPINLQGNEFILLYLRGGIIGVYKPDKTGTALCHPRWDDNYQNWLIELFENIDPDFILQGLCEMAKQVRDFWYKKEAEAYGEMLFSKRMQRYFQDLTSSLPDADRHVSPKKWRVPVRRL